MNIEPIKPLVAVGALLASSACAEHALLEQSYDAHFGEANRQTMMAQVVNPDPVYPEEMATSGDHAADAIERYREDKVKQPESIRTTNVGEGSGSGSGPQ